MSDEPRFAKGDLNGVMAAYPHVGDWVRDFEQRYGTRQYTTARWTVEQ